MSIKLVVGRNRLGAFLMGVFKICDKAILSVVNSFQSAKTYDIFGKEKLYEIYQYIKDSYLSRDCFPILVIGTGLSVTYGISGMKGLSERLEQHFCSLDKNNRERIAWEQIECDVKKRGLEAGLEGIANSHSESLIKTITQLTAGLMISELSHNLESIKDKASGFKKLLKYLSNTCSVNNRIIDVMTPNYDLVIELVCDDLGIEVIDGFVGNLFCSFKQELLEHPSRKVKLGNSYCYVRLFKPHGSVNWIKSSNGMTKVYDLNTIMKHVSDIAIIPPGGDKYRQCMTTTEFRKISEAFNSVIAKPGHKSLLIYGYGFNDEHFNNAILESVDLPILVVTKEIREDVVLKLKERGNIVAFFLEENHNTMLYEGEKYTIPDCMWDMDVFVSRIIS